MKGGGGMRVEMEVRVKVEANLISLAGILGLRGEASRRAGEQASRQGEEARLGEGEGTVHTSSSTH